MFPAQHIQTLIPQPCFFVPTLTPWYQSCGLALILPSLKPLESFALNDSSAINSQPWERTADKVHFSWGQHSDCPDGAELSSWFVNCLWGGLLLWSWFCGCNVPGVRQTLSWTVCLASCSLPGSFSPRNAHGHSTWLPKAALCSSPAAVTREQLTDHGLGGSMKRRTHRKLLTVLIPLVTQTSPWCFSVFLKLRLIATRISGRIFSVTKSGWRSAD